MRKRNFVKLSMLFLIFLLFGCREESNVIDSQNEIHKASLVYKKYSEIAGLKNLVNDLNKSRPNKNISDLIIDLNSIVIEMNLLDGRKAYSIVLENNPLDAVYTVKNIHILENGDNNSYLISHYIPNDGLPFYNLKDFKGNVVYSDLDGNILKTISSDDFFYRDNNNVINNKQIMEYVATELGCYGYVIAIWSDGSSSIYSSVNNCASGGSSSGGGYSDGGGSGGSGEYGDWDSGSTSGGSGSSNGTYLPTMPNIPTDHYVEQKKFEAFYKTLTELQKDYLLTNEDATFMFFYYLKENNFNSASNAFSKWGLDFLLLNPNINSYDFKKMFLDDIPVNFHQQLLLEDSSQILNYESLNSPYFKMRRLDQIKYPKFTQMVKGLKAYVQSNPVILNKLIEISGMSQSQILDKLTFGQGPQIELIPGLLVYGQPAFGAFDHSNPNILMVNENFALGLQQTTNSVTEQATSFLLAVTILHEFVHYGNYLTGYDTNGQETGNLFENQVFGIKINKVTAHQYIVRFLNK